MVIARSNCSWAAGVQDTGKWTGPYCSAWTGIGLVGSACAQSVVTPNVARAIRQSRSVYMIGSPPCWAMGTGVVEHHPPSSADGCVPSGVDQGDVPPNGEG